jgi:hypothetical protein
MQRVGGWGAVFVLAFVLGSVTGVVRADAISGPPACPPGARGESAHSGEWCVPWRCTQDGECGPGHVCRPWRVCTRASDVLPGGLHGRDDGPERMEMVMGTCAASERCRGDEEPPPPLVGELVAGAPIQCTDGSYCLAADALPELPARPASGAGATTPPTGPPGSTGPASAAPPTTGHGCGCSVPTAVRSLGSGLVIAIGIAALAHARARRRRR